MSHSAYGRAGCRGRVDEQGRLIGETLEHALAALKRELAGQGS